MSKKNFPKDKRSGKEKDQNKRNGSKPNQRDCEKPGKDSVKDINVLEGKDDRKGTIQDAAWYISDPDVRRYATSLVTKRNIGAPIVLNPNIRYDDGGVEGNPFSYRLVAPGISVIHVLPTFGETDDPSRGLAAITQQNYRNIRAMASGTTAGLEKADIMTYLIAIDSALICYYQSRRLYGLLNKKLSENNYLPRAVATAFNLNYESWMTNAGLAKLYQALYRWRATLAKFVMPMSLPLFARRELLSSFGFFEEERADDQLYFFNYDRVWTINVDAYGTNNRLTLRTIIDRETPITVDEYIANIDGIMERINLVEDLDNLSALMQKAYGPAFIDLPTCDPMYETPLAYNKDILVQIQNATIMPQDTYVTDMIEVTDPKSPMSGFLTYEVRTNTFNPNDVAHYKAFSFDKVLTIDQSPEFTADQLVESTRLVSFGHFVLTDLPYLKITSFATEVVTKVDYIYFTYDDNGKLDGIGKMNISSSAVRPNLNDLVIINFFHHHPAYYGFDKKTKRLQQPIANFNQIAPCTEDYLNQLDYLATRGVLALPSKGIN